MLVGHRYAFTSFDLAFDVLNLLMRRNEQFERRPSQCFDVNRDETSLRDGICREHAAQNEGPD